MKNNFAPFLFAIFLAFFLASCGGSSGSTSPGGFAGNANERVEDGTGGDNLGNDMEPPLETGSFRVLVFSKTDGFRHVSIERGIMTLQTLGDENNFIVDATEDSADFTTENLEKYRVVIWLNTTLNVLETDAQQNAFEQFVRGGGGYVGIHSAADTEHDWPFYGELVGAYFLSHPVQQNATFDIEQDDHITVSHLPNPWTTFDELYSFSSNPRGAVNVLMSVRESSYMQKPNTSCLADSPTFPNGYTGEMGDHPMSWCHDKFAGRAWYTALGHEIAQYETPEFRNHILNGILLTARRVAGSCSTTDEDVTEPAPELVACETTAM